MGVGWLRVTLYRCTGSSSNYRPWRNFRLRTRWSSSFTGHGSVGYRRRNRWDVVLSMSIPHAGCVSGTWFPRLLPVSGRVGGTSIGLRDRPPSSTESLKIFGVSLITTGPRRNLKNSDWNLVFFSETEEGGWNGSEGINDRLVRCQGRSSPGLRLLPCLNLHLLTSCPIGSILFTKTSLSPRWRV